VLAASVAVAQNVGIGTTNPTELLDVAGKGKLLQLQVVDGATSGYVLTSDALGNATWQPAGGGGGGQLPSGLADDVMRCVGGTTWEATDALVITSSGYVGIGTQSPSFSFDLDIGNGGFRSQGSDNVITGQLAISRSSDPTYDLHVDGDARFRNIGINTNPSFSYELYVNGDVRFSGLPSGSGTVLVADSSGNIRKQSSSRRFKEDVRPLEVDAGALLSLQPVRFRWKPEHGEGEDIGLIAEDVAEIVPELVWSETDDEGVERITGVHYDKIAPLLIEVVAEQAEKIESLEGRLAALEAHVAALVAAQARCRGPLARSWRWWCWSAPPRSPSPAGGCSTTPAG
jgi:hypothetical protein